MDHGASPGAARLLVLQTEDHATVDKDPAARRGHLAARGQELRAGPRQAKWDQGRPLPGSSGLQGPGGGGVAPMVARASVTAGARGRGSPSPQASGAQRRFPPGAAQRPATCPPPPRACARTRSRQLPIPGAPSRSPANRAGPRTARLACTELQDWPHVPAPGEVGRCCTVPAPQSPCDPISRRCEARRPASSMRASRRPRRRHEPRRPGQRRS